MKKFCYVAVVAAFLLLGGVTAQSDARVDVSIGVNVPPYSFSSPPHLVVIPGTYVYYVPDIEPEIFFYGGFWYRVYDGNWYRSRNYNGRWVYLRHERVPGPLVSLPSGYRGVRGYRPIPHQELQRNWRRWERNRYWEGDEWWKHHGEGRWERR